MLTVHSNSISSLTIWMKTTKFSLMDDCVLNDRRPFPQSFLSLSIIGHQNSPFLRDFLYYKSVGIADVFRFPRLNRPLSKRAKGRCIVQSNIVIVSFDATLLTKGFPPFNHVLCLGENIHESTDEEPRGHCGLGVSVMFALFASRR